MSNKKLDIRSQKLQGQQIDRLITQVNYLIANGGGGGGPLETVDSNTIQFDTTNGRYYGSFASPRTGSLTLDATGAVSGGLAIVYYENATLDLSETPIFSQGDISVGSVNKVYIERDADGNYTVNVVNPLPTETFAVFTTVDVGITESPANIYSSNSTVFNRVASTDLIAGDWIFQIDADNAASDEDIMFGASEGNHGQWNLEDWNYGIWIQFSTSNLQVIRDGNAENPDVITVLTYDAGDKLKIQKSGSTVTALLNDTVIHTWARASNADARFLITPTDEASGWRVRFPRVIK